MSRRGGAILRFVSGNSTVYTGRSNEVINVLFFSGRAGALYFLTISARCHERRVTRGVFSCVLAFVSSRGSVAIAACHTSIPSKVPTEVFCGQVKFIRKGLARRFNDPIRRFILGE